MYRLLVLQTELTESHLGEAMRDHLIVAKATSHVTESEEDAFAQLYREHTHAVFNYCLYRVGDAMVAEDLTADIFERAWRSRRRFDRRRAQFSTWLFSIARRRVIDWYRSRGRRRTVELDEEVPSPQPGPDTLTAKVEDQRRLGQLIRDLTPHDQELIAMKYGAGLTNGQIGEVLGKSSTAVGSELHRLIRKLRLQWEDAL
ncbi:MAG: ECF RNA polymerase sigma factor SigL [Chloroflexi bacterium ADurb.Bin180]|nr:MAG: ECF RNA polymerase sigma factor SigL [Chloroflexi bacterium ADurb.Bin180]